MANKMPYNLEAEQSVLASILLDQTLQQDIISELHDYDFLVNSHKNIFSCMQDVIQNNRPVDLVTLSDALQKRGLLEQIGGISYLTELTDVIPSAANYRQYVDIVKRDGTLRRLITSANMIIEDCTKSEDSAQSLAYAEKLIFDISEKDSRHDLEQISTQFDTVIDKFEKIQKDKNYSIGLKCGFNKLDFVTNGFKKGNLIILAARPSVGKSTFAMNMVENIVTRINKDAVCAVFALEMTKEELAQRMLCSVGSIPMDDALKGRLGKSGTDEFKRLWETKRVLNDAKVFVDESSNVTPADILSRCRRLKMRQGRLDLIVVDHIQLMQTAKKNVESRQQEVTDISRNLKMIAKELDVPVVALSQLSRQVTSRKGGQPVLSDLRESGAIEQDADIVIFLHKPDMDAGPTEGQGNKPMRTEVIVAKNRNGMLDKFEVLFKGEYVKFVNVLNNIPTPPPSREDAQKRDVYADEEEPEYDDGLESFSAEDLDSLEQNMGGDDDQDPFS